MWKGATGLPVGFPYFELSSTPFGRISIHPRVNPWYSALRVNKGAIALRRWYKEKYDA
jgi:hypothetical protein